MTKSTGAGKRHYFLAGEIFPKACQRCGKRPDKSNHVPIPKPWHDALYMMAFGNGLWDEEVPKFIFRPLHVTNCSKEWKTPLTGGNVVRGLQKAGLVEPLPPGSGVSVRTPRGVRRLYGRTASWWRLTEAGLHWLRTPYGPVSEAARAARVQGSVPL